MILIIKTCDLNHIIRYYDGILSIRLLINLNISTHITPANAAKRQYESSLNGSGTNSKIF
jgi:hypothetical protein